jgi:hypothetical protein
VKLKVANFAFGRRAIPKSNNGVVAMLFCLSGNYTPKALDAMATCSSLSLKTANDEQRTCSVFQRHTAEQLLPNSVKIGLETGN